VAGMGDERHAFRVLVVNLRERGYFEELYVYGKIVLKWNLKP
jgi:hypothetical protein